MNTKNLSGQRGVALLFALGVLSLLLVMGVAFLGNALISQKIAVNSRESASAKLLGRTAIDRVLSHLTMFHLIQARNAGDFYASDASSVFSRLTTDPIDKSVSGFSLTTKRDRIYTENLPILSVSRGKEGTPPNVWYNGSKSLAEWIYVHENGKFSNGSDRASVSNSKIVGRFAYQVLPQTSNSRLSLYAVTAGASRRAGTNLNTAATARIPQKHRWGIDVDELIVPNAMFSNYWKHDNVAELCAPVHDFDNFISILSGLKNSAPLPFYADDIATEYRRRWLEHIFTEGRGRNAREAYSDGTQPIPNWYPRFNIGKFNYYWSTADKKKSDVKDTANTWYQRFLDTPPATADEEKTAVNKIRNNGEEGNENNVIERLMKAQTVDGRYTDSFLYDGQYEVLGLPFLRRIGNENEKGAFEKVEYLRRQIAANLNDYCDDDSIPTSDVLAKDWLSKKDAVDGKPTFTGNEQTPYINEVALGLKLNNAAFAAGGSEEYNFQADLSAEIVAELIRVYENIVPDIKTVQLDGKVRSLDVTFKVTLKGKASGTYTKDDNTTGTISNLSLENVESEGTSAKFENKDFTIKFDSGVLPADGNGPYWVKNVLLPGDPVALKVNFYQKLKELSDAADKDSQGKNVTFNVTLEEIKIEISKVSFNLGNLVLTAELDDFAGGKQRYGIDFVRFSSPSETELYHLVPPTATPLVETYTSLADLNKVGIFYCGIMQAIDPRQNLIAKFNSTAATVSAKESDWYLHTVPTLEFAAKTAWEWGEDKLATRISKGKVNACSSPQAPHYADAVTAIPEDDRDKENGVEDPAWLGSDIKQHISTAVIRNAPMMSPWELGFIHRGIPFQTINLLQAGGIENNGDTKKQDTLDENAHLPTKYTSVATVDGTRYSYGDAGILDQIKMTDLTRSYGKVDISALQTQPVNWIADGENFSNLRLELFKSLFEGIFKDSKTYQAMNFVQKVTDLTKASDFAGVATIAAPDLTVNANTFSDVPTTALRSKVLGKNDNLIGQLKAATNDAGREELIGKTINLIEGRSASLPSVFKVVVVTQAIRDLSGPMTRFNNKGELKELTATIGDFDATIVDKDNKGSDLDSSIYFDEILGECRMLVTVEKIHYMDGTTPRARLRVKQIEYLD